MVVTSPLDLCARPLRPAIEFAPLMTWGGSVAATSLRRLYAAVALFATACALMLAVPGAAAHAAPGSEGGSKKLEDALESAAKGQADAIQKLNSSKKRQADLQKLVV